MFGESSCYDSVNNTGLSGWSTKFQKQATYARHHYIFIISQMWLTSHPRSALVLPDTGTPGTSREIYSEDADDGTRTRNSLVINRVL